MKQWYESLAASVHLCLRGHTRRNTILLPGLSLGIFHHFLNIYPQRAHSYICLITQLLWSYL